MSRIVTKSNYHVFFNVNNVRIFYTNNHFNVLVMNNGFIHFYLFYLQYIIDCDKMLGFINIVYKSI